MPSYDAETDEAGPAPVLFATLAAVSGLGAVLYLLGWMQHGLDFTDESFSINWIRQPWSYPLSATQFGFFYHPLYAALSGNLAQLRALNLLATVGLGTWVVYLVLGFSGAAEQRGGRMLRLGLALPVGLVSYLVATNWVVTPNYNFLTMQGLLVATAGLLLITRQVDDRGAAAFLVLGVGGWITFLGKPPAAAILAVVALVFLAVVRRLRLGGLAVAVASAALLLAATAWFVDGSIGSFVTRLIGAAAESKAMDGRYDMAAILRFDDWYLPTPEALLLPGLGIVAAVVILLTAAHSALLRTLGAALGLVFAGIGLATLFGVRLIDPGLWSDRFLLQLLALPLGAAMAAAVNRTRHRGAMDARLAAVAALLLILPYGFAAGTNNSYWWIAATGGMFWCAAALAIVQLGFGGGRSTGATFAVAMLSVGATAVYFAIGMAHPYRQPQAVQSSQSLVAIGATGNELVLAADFALYVENLRRLASQNGFVAETPLIDLTGHSPGAALAIDASSAGRPWFLGGYPGSDALASATLLRLPCDELARAWLLVEPAGVRPIPQTVLPDYGLRYASVGTVATPVGELSTSYDQQLLKPTHDVLGVVAACQSARRG